MTVTASPGHGSDVPRRENSAGIRSTRAGRSRGVHRSAAEIAEPPYELVDLDRYVILRDGPIGYVEVVHPVFVSYVGHPFARAVEVAQAHDFHRAVAAVLSAAATPAAGRGER